MSVYIPLATKYRPQKFSDVVGQDITIKIITRGLQKNRLGAAMLFSGTRGVGKTTIARILAKAFRCENSDPEPCCKCEYCLESAKNNQMDVIEIDAASNTSVDDVREIIESCRYKPTTGKFKIFIIDEVHMLSKSAFNALLKTLEEPAEHVKFLMATTETHKIPETILSRVLKFDLKRVDESLIAQYLSSICHQENVVACPEALSLMAKAADGSLRDSLSILDQAISMAETNELSVSDLKNMLSVSDDSDVLNLLASISTADIKSAIAKYREIINGDVSCEKIANLLLDYVYVLTCLKSKIEPLENIVSADVRQKLVGLATNVALSSLSRIWQMLLKGIDEMKICDDQEIVLEMLIIRIAYASGLPDLQEIIGQCDNTQKNNAPPLQQMNNVKICTNSQEFKKNNLHDGINNDKRENKPEAVSNDITNNITDEALRLFPGAKLL
ncbi:MAG: DNA polymerase III subunit gamma/tau [Holosporaceae bacterium]|jgi:DNA polymerase-3 subunit gamma/tau|nr:DNA polymerase III subunit gamma/tau [Holosporaceae bacterium]